MRIESAVADDTSPGLRRKTPIASLSDMARRRTRAIAGRCAEHGQQYTPNRRAVVDALAAAGGPITLPELLAVDRSLAQSSAYRSLSVLVDVGADVEWAGANDVRRKPEWPGHGGGLDRFTQATSVDEKRRDP